jgi:hypothetical protein
MNGTVHWDGKEGYGGVFDGRSKGMGEAYFIPEQLAAP